MAKSIKKETKKDEVKPTSFKLSADVRRLLDQLAKKSLRSQAKTLEFLIIEAAKKEGIK